MTMLDEETARTRAVAAYGLAPDNLQSELGEVLSLAASRWNAPRATFTVVEGDRQFFPARLGMESSQTAREAAICAECVKGRALLISPDTREDPRLRDHPAVTGPPFIRFYAGVPLRLGVDDVALGTLCVLDTRPRPQVGDAEVQLLLDLSALVLDKLAERRARLKRRRSRGDVISVQAGEVLL